MENFALCIILCYTNFTMENQNFVRLSISEAAKMFGVNPQTIRRALKAGELTYIMVQGKYKINFESLVRWSQGLTAIRNKTTRFGIGQYVDKWRFPNSAQSAIIQKKKRQSQIPDERMNPTLPL